MDKQRAGLNFLIGAGIGHIARKRYDQKRAKKELREIEKRKAYKAVYGEEAYQERYGEPEVVYTKQYVNQLDYEDEKKNPLIAMIFTLITGSLGYLYVSSLACLVAFLFNFVFFVVGLQMMNTLGVANPNIHMHFAMIIVIVRILHACIAVGLTVYKNNELKEELDLKG